MHCPSCGANYADSESFCVRCQRQPGETPVATNDKESWEYREETVLLNLTSRQRDFVSHYDRIIRDRLQLLAPDGWHPAEPVDWGETWAAGRVRRTSRKPWYRILGIGGRSYTWHSATIRLKRRAVT